MDEEEKTEAEAKKVEIRVNVMSNVELEETLEQEVVEILKEKIVKDSDDDVLIEVTVSEDLPKEDDSEMVEARTNAKEDKKSAVNLVVLNKEESAQTEE